MEISIRKKSAEKGLCTCDKEGKRKKRDGIMRKKKEMRNGKILGVENEGRDTEKKNSP